MRIEDVQQLTGAELDFAYATARGWATFGCAQGPFAMYRGASRTFVLFGREKDMQRRSSFSDNLISSPLEEAQELGASISVKDGIAHCEIDEFTTSGDSIGEALLRCLVLWHSSRKTVQEQDPGHDTC